MSGVESGYDIAQILELLIKTFVKKVLLRKRLNTQEKQERALLLGRRKQSLINHYWKKLETQKLLRSIPISFILVFSSCFQRSVNEWKQCSGIAMYCGLSSLPSDFTPGDGLCDKCSA